MPQTAFHTASGAVLFVLQGSRRDRRKITKQVTEESHSFQDSDRFLSQKNKKKYYYRAHYLKRGCSSVGHEDIKCLKRHFIPQVAQFCLFCKEADATAAKLQNK